MSQIRKRLTYANVMSSIAVFLVLGGATAFAASSLGKNTVGSKQLKANAVTAAKIKNGAVTGAKINVSSLGTVPSAVSAQTADSAKTANSAKTADSATTATTAVTAGTANTAGSASNAAALGGVPASGYARTQLESVHYVGQPGQPGFENACANLSSEFEPVGFYKDNNGIVHLTGVFNGCAASGTPGFTLPAGFRPRKNTLFSGYDIVAAGSGIRVDPDGSVRVFGTAEAGLNGDTFRAE